MLKPQSQPSVQEENTLEKSNRENREDTKAALLEMQKQKQRELEAATEAARELERLQQAQQSSTQNETQP